nr:hypothetical protein [uncultured Lichenicoccus sp.]
MVNATAPAANKPSRSLFQLRDTLERSRKTHLIGYYFDRQHKLPISGVNGDDQEVRCLRYDCLRAVPGCFDPVPIAAEVSRLDAEP